MEFHSKCIKFPIFPSLDEFRQYIYVILQYPGNMQTIIQSMSWITLRYRNFFLKYTIDEYDHFLCFLAAESEFDIRFSPSRLNFAVQEVEISAFL